MAEVKVIVNDKMIVAEAAFCGGYFLINMTGDCISLDKEDGETITVPVSGLPKLEIAFEALTRTRTEGRTKLVEMITAGPKLKNVPVVIDPSPMYIFLFTKEDAIKVAATKYASDTKVFSNHAYVLLAGKGGDDQHCFHYAGISKI